MQLTAGLLRELTQRCVHGRGRGAEIALRLTGHARDLEAATEVDAGDVGQASKQRERALRDQSPLRRVAARPHVVMRMVDAEVVTRRRLEDRRQVFVPDPEARVGARHIGAVVVPGALARIQPHTDVSARERSPKSIELRQRARRDADPGAHQLLEVVSQHLGRELHAGRLDSGGDRTSSFMHGTRVEVESTLGEQTEDGASRVRLHRVARREAKRSAERNDCRRACTKCALVVGIERRTVRGRSTACQDGFGMECGGVRHAGTVARGRGPRNLSTTNRGRPARSLGGMGRSGWALWCAIGMLCGCRTNVPTEVISPTSQAVEEADPRSTPPVVQPSASPTEAHELPFTPSDDDRATLGTGFIGGRVVPTDTGYAAGAGLGGVQPGGALANAGIRDGDILVELGGKRFDGPLPDVLQSMREVMATLRPDERTRVVTYRKGEGVRGADIILGRAPPRFNRQSTPDAWFTPPTGIRPDRTSALRERALDLDNGRKRHDDTFARQRAVFAKRDAFLLPEIVTAQADPFVHDELLTRLAADISADSLVAARVSAAAPRRTPSADGQPVAATLWECLDRMEIAIRKADAAVRAARGWTAEDEAFVVANLDRFTDWVFVEGGYIHSDDDVARERANRRFVQLLGRVDRGAMSRAADELRLALEGTILRTVELARASAEPGLIASRDCPVGRIEIWGVGRQRHTTRCAVRIDVGGNDNYLDCGGRADPARPISVSFDAAGDDIYGATASFVQGAAFGGIGILYDRAGDDQYLARQWSQGACLAGFGLLDDRSGDDVYRANECSQGFAVAGGAVLRERAGHDTYTAQKFAQGVGCAAGVGAIVDTEGSDRYVCTGRYASEYGEPGVFSGWGQGVGFGLRRIASGGIGLLVDDRGDDVYEAGNFSQGGAYFFGWGALLDARGNDRYIGSRYAQGFAAHQAAGTFIDRRGNDRYQSHAGVAQGLSWDQTCVFFRDGGGDDIYETRGFSLAATAHNGICVFIEDGGDDVYADLPGKAASNTYHGGHSFALFADLGGRDQYGSRDSKAWNDRVSTRHDGAYTLDLPHHSFDDLRALLRDEADTK